VDQTDLIHARGTRGITVASVTITFDNRIPEASCPAEYKACEEIIISRQIKHGHGSAYRINGRLVTQEKIHDFFGSVKLSIKNPQFLIMQGRITKICNASEAELLALVEEAAGTSQFKQKSANARKTLDKKEEKLKEIHEILTNEIGPKMKAMEAEAETYNRHERLKQTIDQLELKCAAYEYNKYLKEAEDHESKIRKETNEAETAKTRQAQAQIELNEGKRALEELERLVEAKQPNAAARNEISKQVSVVQVKLKNLQSRHAKETEIMNQDKKKLANALQADRNAEVAMKQAQSAFELAQQRQKDMENRVSQLESSLAHMQGKAGGRGRGHDESSTMQGQLMQAEQQIATLESERHSARLRLESLTQTLSQDEAQLEELKAEHKRLESEYEEYEKRYHAKKQELAQKGSSVTTRGQVRPRGEIETEMRQIAQQCNQINGQLRELEAQLNARLDFQFTRWTRNFDESRVRGRVASLITVKDEKEGEKSAALALEIVAGGNAYAVVVDNHITGRELLDHGQLRMRTTILPLDKVEGRRIPQHIVDQIETRSRGKARLALDLVTYDPQYQNIAEFVFGSVFVCEDKETAMDITFNSGLNVRTVTKDGDLYNPGGTLTGGYRQNQEGPIVAGAQVNRLRVSLCNLNARLEQLREEHAAARGQDDAQRELQDLEFQMGQMRDLVEKSRYSRKLAKIESIRADIQTCKDRLEKSEQTLVTTKTMAEDLRKAIAAMNTGSAADRAKVLENLERELATARKQLAAAEKAKQDALTASSRAELESKSAKEELARLEEVKGETAAKLIDLDQEISKVRVELANLKAEEQRIEEEFNAASAEFKSLSAQLNRVRKNNQDLVQELENLTTRQTELAQSIKARKERISELQRLAEQLDRKHKISESKTDFDFTNFNLEQQRASIAERRRELQTLSRSFNPKSLQRLENAKRDHAELLKNERALQQDKVQILQTINEVDNLRRAKLKETARQVSENFNKIFSELLPTCTCRLEPIEDKTTDTLVGLEMKVAFDRMEKSSLSELSGGQRSLLALSLILALLKVNPAPLYILDEVDAALDLSHTQNIGSIIRNHFGQSQFVVVSLKEGMFNHADVLFRTSFVDGVSKVTRIANESSRR